MKLKKLLALLLALALVLTSFSFAMATEVDKEDPGTKTVYVRYFVDDAQYPDAEYRVQKNVGDTVLATEKPSDPTKEGYTFDGWYYGNVKWVFGDQGTLVPDVEQNLDLTAKFNANEYQITFDVDGGTPEVQTIVANYGDPITKPADPTKTGYTFDGWYDGETKVETFPATMPLNGAAYKAHWLGDPATVTFVLNNGEEDIVKNGRYGDELTAPTDVKKTGYALVSWTPEVPATFPAGTESTYSANWQVNVYTARFVLNGGTAEGAVEGVVTKNQDYGTKLEAPAATKEGYTLTWSPAVPETMPENGGTYEAVWTVKGNKLTFADSDPAPAPYEKIDDEVIASVAYGTSILSEAPLWEHVGYDLSWVIKDEATETPVTADTKMPDAATTVTAKWTAHTHSLTAVNDKTSPVTKIVDQSKVPFNADIKSYQTTANQFLGTAVTEGNVTYKAAAWNTEIPATMPDEDILATPIWKQVHTVTFVDTEGTGFAFGTPVEGKFATGDDATKKATLLDGYSFAESFSNGLPTAKREGEYMLVWLDKNEEKFDATTPITEDITLHSAWEKKEWTVSFDTGYEDVPNPVDQIINHGAKATKPAIDPVKEGEKFLGWYKGTSLTAYDFSTAVTADLKLDAKWDDLAWTVTPLNPDGTKYEGAAVTVSEPTYGAGTVATTVEFKDLATWQKYVKANTYADGAAGWYIGVELAEPAQFEGSTASPNVTATNWKNQATYKYWFRFDPAAVRTALTAAENTGYIVGTITAKMTYEDNTTVTNTITVKIKVTDTTLVNDPATLDPTETKITDKPNAIVTESGAEKKFDVVFDGNDGTFKDRTGVEGDKKTVKVYAGNKVYEPEITKTGSYFEGWYVGETKFDFANTVITADTTITAKWTPNWTLTSAIKPDGTSTLEGVTIVGDTITFNELTLWRNWVSDTGRRPGYNWYIGVRVTPLTIYEDDGVTIKHVKLDDGLWGYSVHGNSKVTSDAETKASRLFDYWPSFKLEEIKAKATSGDPIYTETFKLFDKDDDTGREFTIKIDCTNVDLVDLTNNKLLDEHVLVVENGKEQTVKVTFDPDNGSAKYTGPAFVKYNRLPANKAATTSTPAVMYKPDDPSKEGYAFEGWYLGEEPYDFDTRVEADIELKAKWAPLYTAEALVKSDAPQKMNAENTIIVKDWGKDIVVPITADNPQNDINGWTATALANVKKLAIDKNGATEWGLKVRFTSPDDVSKATVYMNGEEITPVAEGTNAFIATIPFTIADVLEWAATDDHRGTVYFRIYNDENDEDGQLFTVVLDVTNMILVDTKATAGTLYQLVVDPAKADKQKHYEVTIKYDNPDDKKADDKLDIVHGNYVVPTPVAHKKSHYEFDSWHRVAADGGLVVDPYVFTTPVIDSFALMPKWKNHDWWDVEDTSIPASYSAETRTLTFEDITVAWDENRNGYVVSWKFVAPDSLSKPATTPEEKAKLVEILNKQRVLIPGEGDNWRELKKVLIPDTTEKGVNGYKVNGSGNYFVEAFVTITEKEMLDLAGEPMTLVYKFGTEGNLGDAVVMTVVINSDNIKFVKDGFPQTKIVDGKQVWEVHFADIDVPYHYTYVDVIDGECAEPLSPEPEKEDYAFAGWELITFDGEGEPVREAYDFTTPVTSHILLDATWTELATVTFEDEAGEVYAEAVVPVGTEAKQIYIDVPEKIGYTGTWYDSDTREAFDWESEIIGDTVLYPEYEIIKDIIFYQGALVNFQGEIRLGIQLKLNDECEAEAYKDYKVVFTRGENVTEVPFADATEVEIETYKYRFYAPVPIRYWDEEVTIQIMNGDEVVAFFNERSADPDCGKFVESATYSVKEYAESTSGTETMKALKKALGVYALAFSNYAKGTSYLFDVSAADFAGIDDTVKGLDGETIPEGLTLVGTTVNFKAANALKAVFGLAEGHTLDEYTFTIDGTAVEPTLRQGTTNQYEMILPNISAKNLADKHTFVVSDGTNKFTVIMSCMTYAKSITKSSSNVDMQNLAKALYLYYKAADAQLN